MIARLVLVLAALVLWAPQAFALEGGPFFRDDCTTITAPVTNKILCWDQTNKVMKYWNGSTWVTEGGSGGTPAGSSGQVQFNSSGAFGANANLFWDISNHRLGIGTNAPLDMLDVRGNLVLRGPSPWVDPTSFGAAAVASAAVNRAAIQSALDSCPSTGCTMVFPMGIFLIDCSTTINVTKPVHVIGQGRSSTTLTATCANKPIFSVATALSVKFEHLTLTTNIARTAGGYGIKLQGAAGTENQNSYFNNVQFDQQDVGLYAASMSSAVIDNCFFTNNVSTGLFIDNTDTPDAGDSKVKGSHFIAGAATTHIFQQAAGGLEVIGNKFSGGLNAYTVNARNGVQTSVLQFVGNSCEDFAEHCLIATTTGTGTWSNMTITGNECRAVGGTGPCFTLDGGSSSAIVLVVISSNVIFIDQANTRGIEVIHAQDVLISGNAVTCGSSSGTTAFYIDAASDRPALAPNFSNNCAIAVENNGTLATTLAGPMTMVPRSTSAGDGGRIAFRELLANGTNTVTLAAPDSLAADIKITLPSVLPGGTYCMQMSATGVISDTGSACGAGGGAGITSLNSQSGASQTFANDTNVTITSAADTHTLGWSGTLSVARGGTGLSSGTSGGVPAYTASGTITSSAALTNHALVVGGGAGAVPKTIAALTNGQLAIGSTGADPVPATITAGTGISVTNGAGSITIANTGPTGSGATGRCGIWSSSTALTSDANCNYDTTNHRLGLGTASPTVPLDVRGAGVFSASASAAPTMPTGGIVQALQATNTATYFVADAAGAQGGLIVRRSNGTPAAPTALAADDPIGALIGQGYGTAFTSDRASVGFFAKQNWTGAAQGTYMTFGLTPSGSTVFDEYARLDADLGFRVRGPEPWVDVTAFGGSCDGTNQRAQFQNAINSGAKIVRFPAGTCAVGSPGLSVPSSVTLQGSGTGATTLKRFSGTDPIIFLADKDTSDVRIQDMKIDGNAADGDGIVVGTGTSGTVDFGTSNIIQRIHCVNFAASSSSSKACVRFDRATKVSKVVDVLMDGGSVGIRNVDSAPPIYIASSIIINQANAAVYNSSVTPGSITSPARFGALIYGSFLYGNSGYAVKQSDIAQLHIYESYIESNGHGLLINNATDIRLVDNFTNCPNAPGGTEGFIDMTGEVSPLHFTGNTIGGGGSTCIPIKFTSLPGSPAGSLLIANNKIDAASGTSVIPASVVVQGNTQNGVGNIFFAGGGNFTGFVGLNVTTPLYRLHVDSGATVQSAIFTSSSATAYSGTTSQENRMSINMPNTANAFASFGFSIDTTTTLAQFGMKYLGGGLGDFFWKCYNGSWSECMSLAHDGVLTLPHYGGGTGVVTVGAVDSCGAGFRCLRVPN